MKNKWFWIIMAAAVCGLLFGFLIGELHMLGYF